ncbi:MAG TPA: 50S ribosomal protein L11 [Candidatus Korarchaeota archaeon]|nr:50S ribosomal protein L11 [Candidatus Korarchaeota archaeon]
MPTKVVKVLVEGGKATPGPPLGPAIGGLGLNIGEIVNEINQKTKEYQGMKVPVEIVVDLDTKRFEIKVGIPATSMLILRELGVDKGSGQTGTQQVGELKFDSVLKIAKIKLPDANTNSLKSMVKMVLGTAVSMGVTVEGKDPGEVIKEVDEGKWDHVLEG